MATADPSDLGPYPLGDLLKAARTARKLSLEGAAERAGFAKGKWHMIERGHRSNGQAYRPSADDVVRAARAVNADPREALRAADYDPAIDAPDLEASSAVTASELAAKMSRLTPSQRAAILATIDAMLDPERDLLKPGPLIDGQ